MEGGDFTPVENKFANATGGVGPRAAQVLIDRGAKVLITGNVGGNALAVIQAAGIEVFRYRDGGSAEEAFRKYQKGLLEKIA